MLSSFREKIKGLQEGIRSSLNINDTSSYFNQNSKKGEYLAGAHLLMKYQQDWQGIHILTENNVKLAKAVDEHINGTYKTVKSHWRTFTRLTCEIEDMNNIVALTEHAVNTIGNMRTLTEEIYKNIVELENLIEQERESKSRLDAIDRLDDYHSKKLATLDALREKLAKDHEVRLRLVEEEKEEVMKKNFVLAEKRFLDDLTVYKETGILPRSDTTTTEMLTVEDVEIEQDLESLQEYLNE